MVQKITKLTNNDNTTICMTLKEYGKVEPKLFQQLLITYGNPENIFYYSPEDISSMISRLNAINIKIVCFFDETYPESLRKIADPPILLYVKGDPQLLSKGGVAIVGTTSADEIGIKYSIDFARKFTDNGLSVISGLSTGIDSAAHLGSLKNNGKTIAVIGSGHLNIYPEENVTLGRLIAESGAVVSEYDVHAKVSPNQLTERNRIIAALADIVVLMQIGNKTKSELHIAQAAIDQGKLVYVYDPDSIYDSESLLGNMINKIRTIDEVDEILEYITI
jgi:DNA processing protein